MINIFTPMACTVIENQQRNQGNTDYHFVICIYVTWLCNLKTGDLKRKNIKIRS